MDVARRQLIYVTRDPDAALCARFEERGWQIEIVASARDTRKALRGDLAMGGLLDLSGHFESHELAAFESSLTMTNVGWVAAAVPGLIAGVLVAGLAIFFPKTSIGRALRAVADDHAAAQSVGIPISWIWFVVWLVAGLVALVAATV